MYENDSFLTLSMSERIGLVCVTLALSLFVIYAYRALSFKRSFGIRIGLAFVFTESDRLSHHGQGILGWILINMSFWPGRKNITSTSSPRH